MAVGKNKRKKSWLECDEKTQTGKMLVLIGEKWEDRSIWVRKNDDQMIGDDYLWTRTQHLRAEGPVS